MPKIGNCKIVGHPSFQGRPQFPQITTLNINLLNEVRHNIYTQCHGNYIEVKKKINYMLAIDILRNYFPKCLGALMGDF